MFSCDGLCQHFRPCEPDLYKAATIPWGWVSSANRWKAVCQSWRSPRAVLALLGPRMFGMPFLPGYQLPWFCCQETYNIYNINRASQEQVNLIYIELIYRTKLYKTKYTDVFSVTEAPGILETSPGLLETSGGRKAWGGHLVPCRSVSRHSAAAMACKDNGYRCTPAPEKHTCFWGQGMTGPTHGTE